MSLLPNYNPFFAAGIGTIWATRWEPAPRYQGRVKLLSTPPISNLAFWHTQIRLVGEIYVDPAAVTAYLNAPDETNPPIIGAGANANLTLPELTKLQNADEVIITSALGRATASILKVRITWKDAGGQVRCIDIDLGAGVDIITPPAHWIECELLLPVAGSERLIPPFFASFPLGFATYVVARADCVMGTLERNFNMTWTDTVYMDAEEPLVSVLIPRKKSTRRVSASSTAAPLGPTFQVWDRNPPGFAVDVFGRARTGRFDAIPSGSVPSGVQSPLTDIAGYTNAFLYDLPDTVDTTTYTLIQELSF